MGCPKVLSSSIAYSYSQLRLKQEQLDRLHRCETKLNQCIQEFAQYEFLCIEPSLSPDTWNGSLANQFNEIRTENIQSSYRDIEHRQFNSILQLLNEKMNQIQEEITSLKHSISSMETELSREQEAKKLK
jgi:hypothetical protein